MKFNNSELLLIFKAFQVVENETFLNEREKKIMFDIAEKLNLKKCHYDKDTDYVECPVEDCNECEYYKKYFYVKEN